MQIVHIEKGYCAIFADSGEQVGSIIRVSNRQWGVVGGPKQKMLTTQHSLYACETWCERRVHSLITGNESVQRSNRSQSSAANACETKTDVAEGLALYMLAIPFAALLIAGLAALG